MKTTYVGTRGYQAPELLLDKAYNLSCDIFSIGVIVFILLTGYPPFEQATDKDRWYKSMTKKNYEVFWKAHRASPLANNKAAKDLIQRMLSYDPKERISIADIKKHEWYNGKFLEGKDLIRALRNRHREMEMKRKKDSRKQADLQTSVKKRDVNFGGIVVPQFLPDDVDESIGLLHTTVDWTEVYNVIDAVVCKVGGFTAYNQETMTLTCKMNVAASQEKLEDVQVFEFEVQVFLSYLYNDDKVFKAMAEHKEEALKNKAKTFVDPKQDDAKQAEDDTSAAEKLRQEQIRARQSVKPCYAVRITRKTGDELVFQSKIRRSFLMVQCGSLFTGVPKNRLPKDEFYTEDEEEDDDYDSFLKDEKFEMDPNKQIGFVDVKANA